jgi:hypothetical protein
MVWLQGSETTKGPESLLDPAPFPRQSADADQTSRRSM